MNDKQRQKSVPSWMSDLFLYLSGFLMVLGVVLATVEVPVRITTDPTAAEQTDLIKAFFPISIGLWVLAFIFFGCSLFLWSRRTSDASKLQKPSSRKSSFVAARWAFKFFILRSSGLKFNEKRGKKLHHTNDAD